MMGPVRDPGAAAHDPAPRLRHGRRRPSPPSPTRSSSSTAPSSRIRSPSACAGAAPRSPSSTTCRRACGPGGPGARARCATMSITCWRCCPFEPEAHRRLGGPPCTYVGHPLIERLAWIAALDTAPLARAPGAAADAPLLVVLPGSRPSEVERLMQPFGEALTRLHRARAGSSRSSFPSWSRCAA